MRSDGSVVGVTGVHLSTSKWGNLCGEISEEGSGTDEVSGGIGGLLGGSSLPALSGGLLLLGGGVQVGLGGLCGFSGTNSSTGPGAGGHLGRLVGLLTGEGEILVEGSADPVGEPEVDLSGGPGGLLGGGDALVRSSTTSETVLRSRSIGSDSDVTVGVGTALKKGVELLGASDAIVVVAP